MPMYDEDVSQFDSRGAMDNKVLAKFYMKADEDKHATLEAGRPIYRDREYIEIVVPGDSKDVVIRPASDMDRQRFRKIYEAFKSGAENQLIGTPLDEVTWIPRSQVEELKYFKIFTIEHLAEVRDDACSKLPGLHELKRKAKAFVQAATDNAPLLAMDQRVKDQENEINALKESLREAVETIKELKKSSKA
jgi:hypothetical protein